MSDWRSLWYLIVAVVFLSSVSCDDRKAPQVIDEPVVASVANKVLYLSDLNNMIHDNTSAHDSTSLAAAYIDQWVRDQLVTKEAARLLSSDLEIDQLVQDYREKLLKIHLEDQIIASRYDTTISVQELSSFYEGIKGQFLLKENLYRGSYAKFPVGTTGLSDFNEAWKSDDLVSVNTFAGAFAEEHHLDSTMWITWPELTEWYEGWSESRADRALSQRQKDKEYEYFLKIVEQVDKGEISPLSYIRPQLERMILHKRKQKILEDYKQELYERALNNNIIKLP